MEGRATRTGTRQGFFQTLSALTAYLVFASWRALLETRAPDGQTHHPKSNCWFGLPRRPGRDTSSYSVGVGIPSFWPALASKDNWNRYRMKVGYCLVTGGAGFIGCAISDGLTQCFERVVAFDNLHPQVHPSRSRPAALHPDVELVLGDVTAPQAWEVLLQTIQPTTIIHLAAETGTGQSLTEATRHGHVNVVGTTVMVDALASCRMPPRRMVLASSRAVYGEGAWRSKEDGTIRYPGQRSRAQLARAEWDSPGLEPLPARAAETRPIPVSVYGATKLAQEHIMSAWSTAFGSELVILRLQNVYGSGQSLANPYTGIVPLFCRLARNGESIPLYEDGRMLRDFVLIDDVADAILRAVDITVVPKEPLDIGTGGETSIADLARRVAVMYGAPAPKICGKYRFGDVRHASCAIDATQAQLGWTPRYRIEEGLARLSPLD
jgi:dTDP-L-rhamnose 4-epimerase